MSDLVQLMALRVQGLTQPVRARDAFDMGIEDAEVALDELVERGLAKKREGRVVGYTLTDEGQARLVDLLAEEGLRGDPQLRECYERFLMLNEPVLKVCSDWQIRTDTQEPNNHSDVDYDNGVIVRLSRLNDRARPTIEKMPPRFHRYADRLALCFRTLMAGELSAFTKPLAESFHSVWFELHQDLMLTLGQERET